MILGALPETLLRRVEDAGLNASAAPQQRWIDGWIVRTCPGQAKRARCINAVADGVLPLQQRLEACLTWYEACGLPAVLRITPWSQPAGLDDHLRRLGWDRFDDTRVMVCAELGASLNRPDGHAATGASRPAEQATATPSSAAAHGLVEACLDAQAYAQAVGTLRGSTDSERAAHASRLRHAPVPYHGLAWKTPDGAVLVCGQAAREGALVGLYDVHTAKAARGQGLARSLCRRLLQIARDEGARSAYLQVDAGNVPARRVYAHLGFVDAYAYHYRRPSRAA